MATKVDSLPADLKATAEALINQKFGLVKPPEPEVFDRYGVPQQELSRGSLDGEIMSIRFHYFAHDGRPLTPDMVQLYNQAGLTTPNQYIPSLSDTLVVNIPRDEHHIRRAMVDAERKRVEMQRYYRTSIEMEYHTV